MIEEKSNRATLKQKAQRGKGTVAQSAEVPQSRSGEAKKNSLKVQKLRRLNHIHYPLKGLMIVSFSSITCPSRRSSVYRIEQLFSSADAITRLSQKE